MKNFLRAALAVLCVAALAMAAPAVLAADGEVTVLYTNDVHNAYTRDEGVLGYAAVAEYRAELEAQGKNVILVDCGDAIQGGVIGALSQGQYLVDIMGQIGYDAAIPGNHEFDYGVEHFLDMAADASYPYLSANFTDAEGNLLLNPYVIVEKGGMKIAFVGATTPKTFSSSTPTLFMNEDGEFIYHFAEGGDGQNLYGAIQAAVDAAKAEDPDCVILLSHLGVDPQDAPYTSMEVIANTTGIDVVLDAHSHVVMAGEIYVNKDGEDVLLTSTGTKLANIGELTLTAGEAASALVSDVAADEADAQAYIDSISAEFDELVNLVVANTEIPFCITDPETGLRMVRSQETNLGDFCADAYRILLGADVAVVNGGGVRSDIAAGDVTYGQILAVHPFGNNACLVKVTGQEILDLLENGAESAGIGEQGSFQQVSGMTFEINLAVPSSVVRDELGNFVEVAGDYRVQNVMIGGEPLELDKTYTLASHNYLIKNGGDGFPLFMDNELLLDEIMPDYQVLMNYFIDVMGGVIAEDSAYANPYGEGRITFVDEPLKPELPLWATVRLGWLGKKAGKTVVPYGVK